MNRTVLLAVAALLASALVVLAGRSVILAWDANPEPDIAGYRIYGGPSSGVYTNVFDTLSNVTGMVLTLEGYAPPTNYPGFAQRTWPSNEFWYPTFFAATAYNTSGLESDFSNEISFMATPPPPQPPGQLRFK